MPLKFVSPVIVGILALVITAFVTAALEMVVTSAPVAENVFEPLQVCVDVSAPFRARAVVTVERSTAAAGTDTIVAATEPGPEAVTFPVSAVI